MATERITPQLVETVERDAQAIYEAMRWAARHAERGEPPPWFPGGNSDAQCEARRAAWDIRTRPEDKHQADEARARRLLVLVGVVWVALLAFTLWLEL